MVNFTKKPKDETQKLKNILKGINEKLENLPPSNELDYWTEQQIIFERKLFALEFQEIIDSA